jgi:hypothetical protein
MTSYIDSLVTALGGAGDRPVLRSAGTSTTGTELLAAIYRYARALKAEGPRPGDLIAPNHPSALAVRYAAHPIGAAVVYLSAPRRPRHPGPGPPTSRWSSPPEGPPVCPRAAAATSSSTPPTSPSPARRRIARQLASGKLAYPT